MFLLIDYFGGGEFHTHAWRVDWRWMAERAAYVTAHVILMLCHLSSGQ